MSDLKIVNNKDDAEFLNSRQAAAFLGVSVDTIYSWVFHRSVPHYKLQNKLLRFKKTDLIQFMEGMRVEPVKTDINL